MSDVERHEMPNGAVIYYRDSDHAYWKEHDPESGKCRARVPGISTISKNDGDTNNDNLLNWAARLTCEGVAREASLGLSLDDADDMASALAWLGTGETVEGALRAERLTWRHLRDEKGRIGGISHGVLQALAEGTTPMLRGGYDHAVADWWHKQTPDPIEVEQVVYSEAHGFAGRFDLRAKFNRSDQGGTVKLIDLKTSGYISNAFHIQLAGYDLAAEEAGIGGSDETMVLQVREDGTWTEWPGRATPEDFLTALATYSMGKRISKQARADWKAWKDSQRKVAA